MTIEELINKRNEEGRFDIRTDPEQDDNIFIRTFDYNGETPINNVLDLITIINEFRAIAPTYVFTVYTDVIQEILPMEDIYLQKCTFEGKFYIENKSLKKACVFSNVTFNSKVSFSNIYFENTFQIDDCIFNSFLLCANANYKDKMLINRTEFKRNVDYSGLNKYTNKSNHTIEFKDVTFYENANFSDAKFNSKIKLQNCIFSRKVQFSKVLFNAGADFENTTFMKLVDFYGAEFIKPQIFQRTDFLGVATFSNTVFHDQIAFIYYKTEKKSYISFENATFKMALDISRANFYCNTSFWNIKIEKKAIA